MEEITRTRILQDSAAGFDNNEFEVYYQAQYNISTGMIIGAEALIRWNHPQFGTLSPFFFIDVFEQNNLISQLDIFVFEEVCKFLRHCIDNNIHLIPVSVNLSRKDVYDKDFLPRMEELREKYGIPVKLIRLEVIESIAAEGSQMATAAVDKFHEYGYMIELDDFGSGYSSLNMLKDIDYDILKLDMKFLEGDNNGRGGTIVSSIIRLAKWLEIPVIAEGVETPQQADFLKSIGCDYAQGYLYARPTTEDDYLKLLENADTSTISNTLQLKETINPADFWDHKSIETLIFNSFVGAAAVFRYSNTGSLEVLRVNHRYVEELHMNLTEKDVIYTNPLDTMSEEDQKLYKDTLQKAIDTGREQECETWRHIKSSCCGSERLCIRSSFTMIGKSDNEYIIYACIRNITEEKEKVSESIQYENQFKNVMEQVNIYYWEYTVATKEMRPCYRCMRDLGLPPLVKNYPEPAIEQGIFPQDYADMYRDWHKQIAEGVDHLEAVIPLTVGRVPFRVRYTTEFDELGRPIKAYGSATLVTES